MLKNLLYYNNGGHILYTQKCKNNISTWTGPDGAAIAQIDYFLLDSKHRNSITKINNKRTATPRQSKQRKIILAHIRIKLKNIHAANITNKLPYCIDSLRKNMNL